MHENSYWKLVAILAVVAAFFFMATIEAWRTGVPDSGQFGAAGEWHRSH